MAKDEKKTITVNDVEHNIDDLNEQQIAMVNHITDLDRLSLIHISEPTRPY